MCVVSNIGDSFRKDIWPTIKPVQWPDEPFIPTVIHKDGARPLIPVSAVDSKVNDLNATVKQIKEEFDKLKKEMEELKKLLKAGKAYDEAAGQNYWRRFRRYL